MNSNIYVLFSSYLFVAYQCYEHFSKSIIVFENSPLHHLGTIGLKSETTIPTNIHTANIIFTNIILMADKQNIPKGKMHSNCRLLPEDIVCKITQRNNIRRANTCDPALKLLNEEITSDIQKHKQNIWK